MHRREVFRLVLGVSTAVLALAGCCARTHRPGDIESASAGADGAPTQADGPWPFAPDSIRVFPLTRVDRDESGQARVVLHVECRDKWGDTTKSLGTLRVLLFETEGRPDAGIARQTLTWDIGLANLDYNAGLFDPATRTYRVNLLNLPEWMTRALDEGGAKKHVIRLKVLLEDPNSSRRSLAGEGEVRF
ncbi:MAG: hypothetical protein SFZ23_06085 [Planctomycetota bacterium]|nr:hypothetical protein [Planctomycetota bacterium]